jgi:hypothetical protein
MGSSQHGKYISWKFFKSKLQKACDVAEGDTDALRKMQNAKYKGDIEAYVDKVKFLNERAGVTKAALRDIIRKALPEAVVRMLPMCGGMDTDKQIWGTVIKAGKAHEEAEYVLKVKSGGGGGESSEKKEKDEEESSSKPKSKRKGKGKKADSNDAVTSVKKDDSNRVSKKYPRRFNDYKDACKGVPAEVIKERRDKELCTRCGKGKHNAKYCAGEVNKGTLPSATASVSAAKPEGTTTKPTVSASTAAIASNNANFYGYVDEEIIDYDSPMSC